MIWVNIRNWLLIKLAGKSTVVINATVDNGRLVVTRPKSLVHGYMSLNNPAGIHIESEESR